MAFSRPTSGQVVIDGRDLTTVRLGDFRKHLGVVLQENFLFDGTVADNIRFARPDAPIERVREVAQLANADTFIESFPKAMTRWLAREALNFRVDNANALPLLEHCLPIPKF